MTRYARHWPHALLFALALALASCGMVVDSRGSGGMQGMEHDGSGASEGAPGSGAEDTQAAEKTESMAGMNHGSADEGGTQGAASGMLMDDGRYSDERFIDAMVPHHRGAVEMAEVALENAEHPEVKRLAEDIVRTQEAEIEQLRSIKEEEFGASEVPTMMSGEDMEGMGMMADPQELANEKPFDKSFIDNMIPHHESAIEMAEVAYAETDNPEIKALASGIIEAQDREIQQMTAWREDWYPEG